MELRASNYYWIYIRNGRAKKVYKDFKGAIEEYGKAINICPNYVMHISTGQILIFFLKIMIMLLKTTLRL